MNVPWERRFLPRAIILAASLLATSLAAAQALVAEEIGVEATRSGSGPIHPLPLISHWNTGKHPLADGWSPRRQLDLIAQGHFLLPWFEHPDDDDDLIERDDTRFRAYYEAAIKRARDLRLPLVLVASQWERFLSREPYLGLPLDRNPNVVTPGGKVLPIVSPFGALEPWREVGRKVTDNPRMRLLQEWYPDPPKVVFLSNNEHEKLAWKDVEESSRYLRMYGRGRDDDFKRAVVAHGWIVRYRALQSGMREGLTAGWKARAIFVGYDAFGPRHFGRWYGWKRHSLYVPGRIDPSPLMWDGASLSFYTDNWNSSTDYRLFSPQIESMNWVFMQREASALNPDFWLELSVWDGHVAGANNDKRAYYARLGQSYGPDRYAGMAQFGMWLLRPRVVREFRGWTESWDDGKPYFMSLVAAVDRVHTNPVLRTWWRSGQLVANTAHSHPYESSIPPRYRAADRWFLLDSDVNPRFPWDGATDIRVFSLALVKGHDPNREWLVYAYSPLGERKNVKLTVPGFGRIQVDLSTAGSFFLVDERTRTCNQVFDPSTR